MAISLTSQEQKRQIQVMLKETYGVAISATRRDKLTVDQLRRIAKILSERD